MGLPAEEPTLAGPQRWLERIHPDDVSTFRAAFDDLRLGRTAQLAVEYRMLHADGQYRWMLCRGAGSQRPDGGVHRVAGSQTDITNRRVAETQLRHDASHDALTGLPNRALLTERIGRCFARQKREPSFRYALLFIDLDRFKVINDSLGHVVGDALLVALAQRFSACVRATDTVGTFTGHVARLGGDEFVAIEEACRQIRAWADRDVHTSIAVNVASRQFAQPGFVDEVRRTLAAAGVDASSLCIEITESATMDPRALDTCTRLVEMGIRLHLDDFGTGYSSLSYLTRMPIHTLKVDRSFVARMMDDPMSAAIVQTVLALAAALGMQSLAEGVETEAQAEVVARMKCSAGQGYLWSRPVEAERAFELLRPRRSLVA